jgi:hypothetical protein
MAGRMNRPSATAGVQTRPVLFSGNATTFPEPVAVPNARRYPEHPVVRALGQFRCSAQRQYNDYDRPSECQVYTDHQCERRSDQCKCLRIRGMSHGANLLSGLCVSDLLIVPHGERNVASECQGSVSTLLQRKYRGDSNAPLRIRDVTAARLTERTVGALPNNAWLVLPSQRGLTGHDERSAASGPSVSRFTGAWDMLGYVACDSIDGARVSEWPVLVRLAFELELHDQTRYLIDEGHMIFTYPVALVPLGVSKQPEVYEWASPQSVPQSAPEAERCKLGVAGSGEVLKPKCDYKVEARRKRRADECGALISNGMASEGSQFLGALEMGGDMFCLPPDKVLPQNTDNASDVYDTHECTTASPRISAPSASGSGDLVSFSLPPAVIKPKIDTTAGQLARALKMCHKDEKKTKLEADDQPARPWLTVQVTAQKRRLVSRAREWTHRTRPVWFSEARNCGGSVGWTLLCGKQSTTSRRPVAVPNTRRRAEHPAVRDLGPRRSAKRQHDDCDRAPECQVYNDDQCERRTDQWERPRVSGMSHVLRLLFGVCVSDVVSISSSDRNTTPKCERSVSTLLRAHDKRARKAYAASAYARTSASGATNDRRATR